MEDELGLMLSDPTRTPPLPKEYTLSVEFDQLGLELKRGPLAGEKILEGVTGKSEPIACYLAIGARRCRTADLTVLPAFAGHLKPGKVALATKSKTDRTIAG